MGAPGVAVAPRRLRLLDHRAQAGLQEPEPETHPVEQRVGPADATKGLEEVVVEVHGRPGDVLGGQGLRHGLGTVHGSGQQGKALCVLAPVLVPEVVGVQAALG